MAELIADLFLTLDGYASGEDVGPSSASAVRSLTRGCARSWISRSS